MSRDRHPLEGSPPLASEAGLAHSSSEGKAVAVPGAEVRVLLDTNIWSRLADCGYGTRLAEEAKSSGARILVAPAALEEAAASSDIRSRNSILRLMADSRWRHGRLQPEIAGEAAELVEAVRRHRPEWIRTVERPQEIELWSKLWTRTVYEAAVDKPQRIADGTGIVKREHGDRAAAYYADQQENRDPLRNSGLLGVFPDIWSEIALTASALSRGAPDRRVPAWAFDAAARWWHNLFETRSPPDASHFRNTHRDWTAPFLDLKTMRADPARFHTMWWDEMIAAEAPRNWMRWAVAFVQLDRKLSRSNAIDNQLASYLFDCDAFVTADARFADVLDVVVPAAPRAAGVVRRVRADPPERFWGDLRTALHLAAP